VKPILVSRHEVNGPDATPTSGLKSSDLRKKMHDAADNLVNDRTASARIKVLVGTDTPHTNPDLPQQWVESIQQDFEALLELKTPASDRILEPRSGAMGGFVSGISSVTITVNRPDIPPDKKP
jgi:hypothetical protein